MRRFTWLAICAILGLGALVCGLLLPAHLRAVDSIVIEKAGENTPGLIQRGLALVSENEIGAAQLFADAAQQLNLAGQAAIRVSLADHARAHSEFLPLAGPEAIGMSVSASDRVAPVTDWFARSEHRKEALDQLEHPSQSANKDAVREMMQSLALTNTVLFPPSQSSSGQAFDTAVAICGKLAEFGHSTKPLTEALANLASQANRGGNPQPFEQALLDFMSLGQRFNWGQLCVFVKQVQNTETLHALAHFARQAQPEVSTNSHPAAAPGTTNTLALLFSEVALSQNPAGVVNHLMNFSRSGPRDLELAMKAGAGGLNELLRRGQPMYISKVRPRLAVELCLKQPSQALAVKWILFFLSGFLLAMGLHFAWPVAAPLERPLQVRGFHLARESLFGLGVLTVILIFTEPFLAEQGQKMELSFGTRLAAIVGPASPGNFKTNVKVAFMETRNLIPIVLFFVLQALLYTACLVKLAEIRRQRVPARVKLRLLDNEDHLFDAGLYLGFVGTIISLILFSLSIVQPSLMAAYSSTSFGIIGVSAFKIFHLRPVRRRMLLESEATGSEPAVQATSRTLVTSS